MKNSLSIALCLTALAAFTASCKPKGPAEKAGKGMDEAMEGIKDTLDPKGPLEKAGEKMDNALGN
jgi:hypothetical protein